jgi:hypothetical protein
MFLPANFRALAQRALNRDRIRPEHAFRARVILQRIGDPAIRRVLLFDVHLKRLAAILPRSAGTSERSLDEGKLLRIDAETAVNMEPVIFRGEFEHEPVIDLAAERREFFPDPVAHVLGRAPLVAESRRRDFGAQVQGERVSPVSTI